MNYLFLALSLIFMHAASASASESLFFELLETDKNEVVMEYLVNEMRQNPRHITDIRLTKKLKISTKQEESDYYLGNTARMTGYYMGETEALVEFETFKGKACNTKIFIIGKVASIQTGKLKLKMKDLRPVICH